MKYIKSYEKLNQNDPQVGNYVICDVNVNPNNEILKITSDRIGKIIGIEEVRYKIKYPTYNQEEKDIIEGFFNFHNAKRGYIIVLRSEIKYFSNNKEELEIKLQQNKYNL